VNEKKKRSSAIKDVSDINSEARRRENETRFRVEYTRLAPETHSPHLHFTHTLHTAPEPWVSSPLPGRA